MSETSYDAVPYSSFPYARTHPDRLCTTASLFGMSPAAPRSARVLEIGCASGGNLLPMAEQLPDAQLVGIDLAARQITTGKGAIEAARLQNVELHACDLTSVDAQFGEFDYIVCHGVFSWIDAATQARLLEVFKQRLRPQGVGLISYNTYPGWYQRSATRDMMRYHVAQFDDVTVRAEQAKALLDFVVEHGPSADRSGRSEWSSLMRREAELLREMPSDYLFHEHLEEHNTPLYFHEFEARARGAGLAYLGDADVHTMMAAPLPAGPAAQLEKISPDLVRLEQYLDFVRGRQFRSTLVCHDDVSLSRQIEPEALDSRFISCKGHPPAVADPFDLQPGVRVAVDCGGGTVHSEVPATKAALHVLCSRWPEAISFAELCDAAQAMLRAADIESTESDRKALGVDVLQCYLGGALELRTEPPRLVREAGPRPRVTAYARWQAEHCEFVTSARHVRIGLDIAGRAVVSLLDGTRDRAGIVAGLVNRVEAGTLHLRIGGATIAEPARWVEPLGAVLDRTLELLAVRGVLLA